MQLRCFVAVLLTWPRVGFVTGDGCTVCADGSTSPVPEKIVSLPGQTSMSCQSIEGLLPFFYPDPKSPQCTMIHQISTLCGCPRAEGTCNLCPDGSPVVNKDLELPELDVIFVSTTCELMEAYLHSFPENDAICRLAQRDAATPCGCPAVPSSNTTTDDDIVMILPDISSGISFDTSQFQSIGFFGAFTKPMAIRQQWTSRIAAIVAIIGALLVLHDNLRRDREAFSKNLYNQIVTVMAGFDLIYSFAAVLLVLPMPTYDIFHNYGEHGTTATCKLQGWALQWGGLTSLFLNAALGTYYLLVIVYSYGEDKLKKSRKWLLGIPLVAGAIIGVASIPFVAPSIIGCQLNPPSNYFPQEILDDIGVPSSWLPITCLVIIPGYSVIVYATGAMIIVYGHVRKIDSKTAEWQRGVRTEDRHLNSSRQSEVAKVTNKIQSIDTTIRKAGWRASTHYQQYESDRKQNQSNALAPSGGQSESEKVVQQQNQPTNTAIGNGLEQGNEGGCKTKVLRFSQQDLSFDATIDKESRNTPLTCVKSGSSMILEPTQQKETIGTAIGKANWRAIRESEQFDDVPEKKAHCWSCFRCHSNQVCRNSIDTTIGKRASRATAEQREQHNPNVETKKSWLSQFGFLHSGESPDVTIGKAAWRYYTHNEPRGAVPGASNNSRLPLSRINRRKRKTLHGQVLWQSLWYLCALYFCQLVHLVVICFYENIILGHYQLWTFIRFALPFQGALNALVYFRPRISLFLRNCWQRRTSHSTVEFPRSTGRTTSHSERSRGGNLCFEPTADLVVMNDAQHISSNLISGNHLRKSWVSVDQLVAGDRLPSDLVLFESQQHRCHEIEEVCYDSGDLSDPSDLDGYHVATSDLYSIEMNYNDELESSTKKKIGALSCDSSAFNGVSSDDLEGGSDEQSDVSSSTACGGKSLPF